jgi:hypothetical protein
MVAILSADANLVRNGMMWERSASQDSLDRILGISSDKLCLPMVKFLNGTPSRMLSPACSYPTMTSTTPFRQIYPLAVLQYAISVHT